MRAIQMGEISKLGWLIGFVKSRNEVILSVNTIVKALYILQVWKVTA
jgi:hypothetical protein